MGFDGQRTAENLQVTRKLARPVDLADHGLKRPSARSIVIRTETATQHHPNADDGVVVAAHKCAGAVSVPSPVVTLTRPVLK